MLICHYAARCDAADMLLMPMLMLFALILLLRAAAMLLLIFCLRYARLRALPPRHYAVRYAIS